MPRLLAYLFSLLSSVNFYPLSRRGGGHERSRKCVSYAGNEIPSSKLKKCDFELTIATFTPEMKFDLQKMEKDAILSCPAAGPPQPVPRHKRNF